MPLIVKTFLTLCVETGVPHLPREIASAIGVSESSRSANCKSRGKSVRGSQIRRIVDSVGWGSFVIRRVSGGNVHHAEHDGLRVVDNLKNFELLPFQLSEPAMERFDVELNYDEWRCMHATNLISTR